MAHIATFYSHFGAISFKNRLTKMGDSPVLMPVPRSLSASCGTCVRFELPFDPETMTDEDLDRVVEERDGGYITVYEG